jgi:secondary thiamine-phosphate synthase enzyme
MAVKEGSMISIPIKSSRRRELIDVTGLVRKAVSDSGKKEGLVVVYVPHTTAGITINENADPDVGRDLLSHLAQLVPAGAEFRHTEGNSDAHIQASLVGSSVTVIFSGGQLVLGTWQAIFFCEFDGPRNRQMQVQVMGS